MTDATLLERFTDEVLSHGPQACLPSSLSDEWLGILADQIEVAIERPGDGRMTEVFAAILHLVAYQNGDMNQSVEISEEELYERFALYRMELALEDVCRHTDVKVEQATLDTILTWRNVFPWQENSRH